MHELSLAMALVEQVEEAATKALATKVLQINLSLGEWSGVDRDSFEFCFPLAAQNSIMEGAKLAIEMVPLTVKCNNCLAETKPTEVLVACGQCGSAAVTVIKGREFTVSSLEVT